MDLNKETIGSRDLYRMVDVIIANQGNIEEAYKRLEAELKSLHR